MSAVQRLNSSTRRDSESLCETDRVTSAELQRDRRVLYFSDGTLEVDTDNEDSAVDVTDKKIVELHDNTHFIGRLKNNIHKIGSTVLAGIDYIGEELASFLGITTETKTLNDIDNYKSSTSTVNPEESANSFNNNRHDAFLNEPITRENFNQV